jgi:hypothetical protein
MVLGCPCRLTLPVPFGPAQAVLLRTVRLPRLFLGSPRKPPLTLRRADRGPLTEEDDQS